MTVTSRATTPMLPVGTRVRLRDKNTAEGDGDVLSARVRAGSVGAVPGTAR